MAAVQNSVPFQLTPQAVSNVSFFQTLGGAISVAFAQLLFQNGIITAMARDVPTVSADLVIGVGAAGLQDSLAAMGLSPADIAAVVSAYMGGLKSVFYVSAGGAICTFLAAAGLSWKKIQKRGPPGPPGAAPGPPGAAVKA